MILDPELQFEAILRGLAESDLTEHRYDVGEDGVVVEVRSDDPRWEGARYGTVLVVKGKASDFSNL